MILKKGRLKCVHGGSYQVRKVKSENRYHCQSCRRKFSLFLATWLKSIKISLSDFIILLHLWKNEYSVKQTTELTNLSVPTIRRYFALFRTNIVKSVEFIAQNNVQVDEAYFGRFKKRANYFHGQRTYNIQDKTCVAGIGCPSTGMLATKVIRAKPGIPIKQFICQQVPTNVHVYSDGSPIYTNLRYDYFHTSRTHDLGFHNAYYIESCWSWMKRKLFKQYHHFHRKNAESYVSELTWRFNIRNSTNTALDYIKNSL